MSTLQVLYITARYYLHVKRKCKFNIVLKHVEVVVEYVPAGRYQQFIEKPTICTIKGMHDKLISHILCQNSEFLTWLCTFKVNSLNLRVYQWMFVKYDCL